MASFPFIEQDFGVSFGGRGSNRYHDEDDEEALKWSALQKLPTYDRVRKGFLHNVTKSGVSTHELVDVNKLDFLEKKQFIDKILCIVEDDNEEFLRKLRARIDNVGIEVPKIEVRFENLKVATDVHIGSRAIPTLYNFTIDLLEGILNLIRPTKRRNVNILHDVNGIIKPSRMTLLLGPPGSGKSTFLLALAGKLPSDVKVSGKITYNGHEISEFIPQRTSAYISQYDTQLSTLTVRETLDFSGRCQGVGSRYDMLVELLKREKEAGIKPDPDIDIFMKASAIEGQQTNIVTDYVLKILGLDVCADIVVGDYMIRGISGGQRKRVTIGEMLVGPAIALFMDEISTGLDSSTTFQILKCLSHIVHVMDATMVVSLLQPSPETFGLFDDVILLSNNCIVYQGPRELILDFFESMGFHCPKRKNVADFLQEITSKKDQEQYWADKTRPYKYISGEEFSRAFKSSNVGKLLKEELSIPFDKSKNHPTALSTRKYGINKKDVFKACLSREWLLMKRNYSLYVFKTCQLSVVAVVTMSVFLRTELHQNSIADGNLYMGALFFGLSHMMIHALAEVFTVVTRLPVYYKQRDQMFYPAWAYSIPNILLGIPFSLLGSCIWVSLTYYVIGFTPEPERFFLQLLLFFCLSQVALGLYRFVGSIARSTVVASSLAVFTFLVLLVMGGFIISKEQIPDWWIWGYWMSPLMYAQNSLAINEFLGDRWKISYNGSVNANTIGTAVLKLRGLHIEEQWLWAGIGALIGFAILLNLLFTMALAYLSPLSRRHSVVSEEANKKKPLNTEQGKAEPSTITTGGKKGGMVLPFQPLSMSFKSISYYVDMPPEMKKKGITELDRLQLLQNVTGAFRPGVLTALMGVSGAGKTTLMDVLAGRKTGGYIEGDIKISGYPKKQETFARISGYCEQNDIHSPNITVRESLVYSAWLRLPKNVDDETKRLFIEEVMDLIELNPIKEALVGLPGVNGLSTEQRKRLTIAVELVANPSILFMDEPTSGLDARAAAIVMRVVRNTVDTGRTVVCTIHQPSIDIFEAFDELFLLKQGGQIIYSGPLGHQSSELIHYFQSIPGVPHIKEGNNPATWMLEISSLTVETRLGIDFAQIYKYSALHSSTKELTEHLSSPSANSKDLFFTTQYSQNFWEQCMACLWKQSCSYWRNPYYNVVRLMFTVAIALLLGTTFWDLGQKRGTIQDVSNIMGALYSATLFLGFGNTTTVEPVVSIERTVFYREKGAGMYSSLAYAFGQVAIEVPYVFVQTLLYVPIVYAMINFEWTATKFFYFFFFMFVILLCFTYYGIMCVAITPSLNFATLISSAFFSYWNLFSGFVIPRVDIPVWWRWYYWADPISWSVYGLIGSQLGDVDTLVTNPDLVGKQQSVKQYIKSKFGYKYDFLGVVAIVHIGLTLLFIFVFAYGIKKINFQKR